MFSKLSKDVIANNNQQIYRETKHFIMKVNQSKKSTLHKLACSTSLIKKVVKFESKTERKKKCLEKI